MSVWLLGVLLIVALPAAAVGAQLGIRRMWPSLMEGEHNHRLDFVTGGVPAVLWIALVAGAVVTIGFATIFGLRSVGLHVLITASLATVIGVLLFVAVVINHPFGGDVVVKPHSLERVLTDFGGPT